MDYPITRHPEFRYKTEFQSHEPEVFFCIFCVSNIFVALYLVQL